MAHNVIINAIIPAGAAITGRGSGTAVPNQLGVIVMGTLEITSYTGSGGTGEIVAASSLGLKRIDAVTLTKRSPTGSGAAEMAFLSAAPGADMRVRVFDLATPTEIANGQARNFSFVACGEPVAHTTN